MMAQMDTPQDPTNSDIPAEDDDALRKRLLSRIAVAGVVIVGLLGGLAVFDSLNRPQTPSLPKMAAAPAEPAAPVEQEVKAEEEKPAEEKVEAKAEEEPKTAAAETVPERTEAALAPPPPPLKAAKPLTAPATARQAAIKPSEPVAAAAKPDAQREVARTMPERTAPAHAPASRPLARAADTARRFLVQVGVFSNHVNAEELVAKLQAAGIPAQIESHVQVGPFASKAEVETARAKLKAMGIDDGILVRR